MPSLFNEIESYTTENQSLENEIVEGAKFPGLFDEIESYAVSEVEGKDFFGRVSESWQTGVAQTKLGQLRYRQLLGEDTEEIKQQIIDLRATMPEPDEVKRGLPERAVRAAAEMLPIQVAGLKKGAERGVKLGGGFAGITALAGQAGPQAALPEEIITVPAAFAGGYGVGMLSGTLENIGQIEAGLAYDELLNLKDSEGNGVDPAIAKAAAASVGVVNGLIEMAQIKLLLKTIPGGEALLRGAINKTLKKAVTSNTLKSIALKYAGKYGTFVAGETGQEVLQESTNILAGEIAKEVTNDLRGTDLPAATIQEIGSRLIETAEQSALAFSVMGMPGTTVSAGIEGAKLKTSAARDTLLNEDEQDVTAKELLTGEKEVVPEESETFAGAESLDAEEAAAAISDEQLEDNIAVVEPEGPTAPKWLDDLTDTEISKRIDNFESTQAARGLSEKQTQNLGMLQQELENRGLPAQETKEVEKPDEKTILPEFKNMGEALTFGKKATPEQKELLKRRREVSNKRYEELISADKLNEATVEATKSQLDTEALDAEKIIAEHPEFDPDFIAAEKVEKAEVSEVETKALIKKQFKQLGYNPPQESSGMNLENNLKSRGYKINDREIVSDGIERIDYTDDKGISKHAYIRLQRYDIDGFVEDSIFSTKKIPTKHLDVFFKNAEAEQSVLNKLTKKEREADRNDILYWMPKVRERADKINKELMKEYGGDFSKANKDPRSMPITNLREQAEEAVKKFKAGEDPLSLPAKPQPPKIEKPKPPLLRTEDFEGEGIPEVALKTWKSEFAETYKKSEFSEPERWDEFKAFSKKEYAEGFPISELFEGWMAKPKPKPKTEKVEVTKEDIETFIKPLHHKYYLEGQNKGIAVEKLNAYGALQINKLVGSKLRANVDMDAVKQYLKEHPTKVEVTKKAGVEVTPEKKEPWQMGENEYVQSRLEDLKGKIKLTGQARNLYLIEWQDKFTVTHQRSVEKAIQEGKLPKPEKEKVEITPEKIKDKKIGEREKGGEIFERADGHRYIIKNGVLVDSPRDILPTGKPLPPKTPKQLFDEKRWDYLTKDEIASFEKLGEPTPGYEKAEYPSAEELAKEGFEPWKTAQGYNDEEAKAYLERQQEKRPSVEFRLVRYPDGVLSLWGRPKKLTKAEKAVKIEPKLAADMTADEMLAEWDKQAGEIEPKISKASRIVELITGGKAEEFFARELTSKEKKSGKAKRAGFLTVPKREGFEVVYKPYGVEGDGYYYQKKIEPTAQEKVAETKAHLSKATDAFKAINEILGEKGVIFEGVDETRWQKIKPLLKVAYDEIIAAGKSGAEFVSISLKNLSPKGKPYFERFVKEEIGKEAKDVTDNIRRAESQETAKADDTGRVGRESAEDVSRIEKESRPAEVSEGDRGTDDAGVQGRVEKGVLREPGSESRPDSAGSKAGDVAKENLGRDPGNISGLQRSDYTIKPGSLKREGSWKDAATNNLDAIELLKKINKEKRPATPKEQTILAKYVGWGASELANKMFPGYAQNGKIIPGWAEDGGWKPSIERLIKVLTPEEIKAAAKSTQYAHYTNEPIIKSIYNALGRMGFDGGKILEPGMGIGNFIGLLPAKMRKTSNYTGIEMDPISAGIAKLLYPTQNMLQADFVNQAFPKNFFDAAIGNPPFGSTKILGDPEYRKHRFSLHNFFFAKTIDRVKPGGLLVFVTSRYTMDSKADKARQYMTDRADLLGAIRLPQTAFLESAGTEVVTDVLFLQKREEGAKQKGEVWAGQGEVSIGDATSLINEYFVAHPEMVLGEHSLEGSMYGAKQYTVTPVEGKIEDLFAQAVKKLPANIYQKVSTKVQEKYNEKAVIERDFDPKNKKEGGIYLSDKGVVMKVDFGSGVPVDSIHKNITPKTTGFLKSYVKLRDALKLSHKSQLENGDWEKTLKVLNREYDRFVKKHGHVLAFTSTIRTKRNEDGTTEEVEYRKYKNEAVLRIDTESSLIRTLERVTQDGEIVKSKVLQGRTINKPTVPKIESIPDALAVSLDTIGKLDVNHVAKTANKSSEEVVATLGDLVYDAPDGSGYLMADEYLSGNVVRKLAEAKVAAKADPTFERNVLALEKAQPEPLEPKQITITPGATWIPLEYYSQFATEILEIPNTEVTYQPIDNSWRVLPRTDTRPSWQQRGDRQGYSPQELRGAASEWGTEERGANEILDSVLNNRTIRITYTIEEDGSRKTIFDAEATAAANEVAKKIRQRFNSWAWEDADRASILLDIYNTKINTIKGREFDGSHLTLPGMSQYFTPYDHQKRVIWRILQTGNTYMAHAVGAGKTFIMISAGMEMRRLGMINKPLYVVPKHMLGQFSQEFQELYPMANILVADEQNFYTENRKRFVAQAALNDPDAVILTHPSFGMLGVKEETLAPVRDEFLEQMRLSLSDMKDEGEPKMKIKRMEKRIEQAEQRFNSLISGGDNVVSFEELGTDFMFVDEAHEFRKLDFATNRQMKGIDPQGSRRAIDLYIKTLWMERQHPGRSHAFASGTPIVNTLGELYSLQRFFDQGTMEEDGINHFDAWANMFGEPATSYEMTASGSYEPVERFSRFVNIPELMSRIRMFMDVLTDSQLGTRVERPKIKDGAAEIVLAPKSEALKKYQDETLQPRIEASRAWKPSPGQPGNPDPIINIITDGKLASIDMRFVDKKAIDDPESKLNKWIDGIIETYKETKALTYATEYGSVKKSLIKGGVQICFYNNGFGSGVIERRGFDSKAFLMQRFKGANIPTKRIGWIDDYKTAPQKQTLFKLVRDGEKRILLGSAKKMGTGVNVQNRLTHLHYLDAPWYPADVEQPDGRIVRQGNQNTEVSLRRYATKGSYDATLWQMVARKSKFIDQAFVGDKNVRSIEDVSESSQYEMAAALASGDERIIQLVGLRADIERLHLLEGAHRTRQQTLASDKRKTERDISINQGWLEDFETVEESLPEYIGPKIDAKVGNVDFTERKEFGAALIKEIRKVFAGKKNDQVKLGSIDGIDVNTETITVSKYAHKLDIEISKGDFSRKVDNTYMSIDQWNEVDAAGLTKKITNVINGLPSVKTKTEQTLEENEKKLIRINKRLGAPFEHSKEFAEKVAETAALERELAEEGESKETIEAEVSKKQEVVQVEKVKPASAFHVYSPVEKGYIPLSGRFSPKMLSPEEIDILWANTFFVHKELGEKTDEPGKGWKVSEQQTGLGAGSGKTQVEAISQFKERLSGITEERFKKIVDDHIKEYGGAPETKSDSLSEAKARLIENIKSEKGESVLINDLSRIGADVIRRGHDSFKAFSAQMKATLSDVWDKIKHLMKEVYGAAKVVLKSKRGAITIREKTPDEPSTSNIDTTGYLPSEVEKRMARAKGGPKVDFKENLKEKITEIRHQRQHFPDLKNIEDETLRAKVNDILRRHQEIPETAKNETIHLIQSFTKNLSKDGYKVYRMNIILADMMRDIRNGLTYDGKLPFGFKTTEEVENAYAKFQEIVKQHPEIANALKKRSDAINNIKSRLVKAKLLKKEVLKDDDYFHHQVIQYWEKKYGMSTGSRDVRTHWRPWMAARKGSPLDYNTDYIEAEFTAVSQQLAQIKVVETLKRIKKEADIHVSLKREAKVKNIDNLWKLLRERGEIEIHDKTGKEIDPLSPWKQKIAMANVNLAKMASDGKLEYDSEWQEIVDALADSYDDWNANKGDIPDYPRPGVNDARWFHFLSYLINTKKPGANWAATVFKAIRSRDKYVQETLGDRFLTYDKLTPKGYVDWKPDPNKGWFWANVITDKILEKIQRGEIDPNDVEARKLLAKGRDLIWVIPEGLATTMDNFRGQPEQAWVGNVADTAMRTWKQYILLNPYSVIRYNLNNTSGDLDACLAYAPEIATKYAYKAFKDLWKWHRRKKLSPAIQKEIDRVQAMGAIQSGFSVQEVTDVYEILSMDRFVKDIILDENPNWFTKAEWYGIKRGWIKYWTFVRMMTAMRENTLRLAAYRFFLDNQNKRLYGASNPTEVDAIADPKEKAAKQARELLGDYGNISKSGEYIRKRLMPFYSWLEINAPRYVYMMRNTKYENRDVDSIKKRAVVVTGKKLILAGGKMALRASMLMGAVMLWNMTVFPDEEDELGETGRRQMHLILGRREDGSIITLRFQGALSDALSFFGLEDWPDDMKDVLKGKNTVGEKLKEVPLALLNRAVQAIRPEPKMLGEMISGKSFYPDILRPLPIRDRVEHALRTFKLDKIYREVLERPGRGKTPGAPRSLQIAEHFVNDLKSLLIYESDPGLLAYYDTRGMVFEWLAKQGDEKRFGGRPTKKGNAFYYYKQAMKYGDLDAAQRYLKKYYDLGGTPRSKLQSIKFAHPLSSISKMKRVAFRQSLTPAQEAKFKRALDWYNKTYR